MVQLRSAFTFSLATLLSVATAEPLGYLPAVVWTVSHVSTNDMLKQSGLDIPPNRGYISTTTSYEDALALAQQEKPANGQIWIYVINTKLAHDLGVEFKSVDKTFDTAHYPYKTYSENEWTVNAKIPSKAITYYRTIKSNNKMSHGVFDNFGRSGR